MNRSALFPILAALLVTGCHHNKPVPPPTTAVVTAAAKQPSASQPVRDARAISDEAAEATASARTRVEEAKVVVVNYREKEYRELQDLVTKLREQATASVEELEELYDRVFAAEKQINSLVTRLENVQGDLKKEKELRKEANEKLSEASELIAAKDVEADQLRQQLEDQKATTLELEANAKENFETAQKAESKASRLQGQKQLLIKVLIGVGITLAISLVVNYIQFRKVF
jgi:chromosome segregation ATPase